MMLSTVSESSGESGRMATSSENRFALSSSGAVKIERSVKTSFTCGRRVAAISNIRSNWSAFRASSIKRITPSSSSNSISESPASMSAWTFAVYTVHSGLLACSWNEACTTSRVFPIPAGPWTTRTSLSESANSIIPSTSSDRP